MAPPQIKKVVKSVGRPRGITAGHLGPEQARVLLTVLAKVKEEKGEILSREQWEDVMKTLNGTSVRSVRDSFRYVEKRLQKFVDETHDKEETSTTKGAKKKKKKKPELLSNESSEPAKHQAGVVADLEGGQDETTGQEGEERPLADANFSGELGQEETEQEREDRRKWAEFFEDPSSLSMFPSDD